MNKDFKSQTTGLVTLFPFRGEGKVNDRLRLDTRGLANNISYTLVYDGSTGLTTWKNVDPTGVDTLYSADGTISENRTVTLDTSVGLDIVGSDGSLYFWTQQSNNPSIYGQLRIEPSGVTLERQFDDLDTITASSVLSMTEGGLSFNNTYFSSTEPRTDELLIQAGKDSNGILLQHTITGTTLPADITLRGINDTDNTYGLMQVGSNNIGFALLEAYSLSIPEEWRGQFLANADDGVKMREIFGVYSADVTINQGNIYLNTTSDKGIYLNGVRKYVALLSQTAPSSATSGSLIIGETYNLTTYVAGDDFTNVADVQSGSINTDGCVFIATSATPTDWTHGSTLDSAGNPIPTILENTLGGTVVWARTDEGIYTATLAGVFTAGKTWLSATPEGDAGNYTTLSFTRIDGDTCKLRSIQDPATNLFIDINDGGAGTTSVEICVYP